MVIHDNESETKENKVKTTDKIEPQHHHRLPRDVISPSPCSRIRPNPLSHVSQIQCSPPSPSDLPAHQRFLPVNWKCYQANGVSPEGTRTGCRFPNKIERKIVEQKIPECE